MCYSRFCALWVLLFASSWGFGNHSSGGVPAQFVAFGGGHHGKVQTSQVALEMNMLDFQTLRGASPSLEYFGAGPDSEQLDVFSYDSAVDAPVEELAYRFITGRPLPCFGCSYRKNAIPDLAGPSTKATFFEAMEAQDPNAPLKFYYTGHGSGAPGYVGNLIHLWDGEVNAREFAEILQKRPESRLTQVIMVQCFSGGFADLAFEGGNPKGALTNHNQCGFFSQVRSRPAAGCSPDILVREGYSPHFFAAVKGTDSRGNPVYADFNGDGIVGASEAHAHVVIANSSIDVPVKTSSELLISQMRLEESDYHTLRAPQLLARSDRSEVAIFKALSSELGVDISRPLAAELGAQIGRIEGELTHLKGLKDHLSARFGHYKGRVVQEATLQLRQFGGLSQRLNEMPDLLAFNLLREYIALKGVEEIMLSKAFQKANEYYKRVDLLEKEKNNLQKRLAKLQRLDYLTKVKALEQNLYKGGDDVLLAKYNQLLACESASFF